MTRPSSAVPARPGKGATLSVGQELVIGSDRLVLIEEITGGKVKVRAIAPEHVHVRKTAPPAVVTPIAAPQLLTTS